MRLPDSTLIRASDVMLPAPRISADATLRVAAGLLEQSHAEVLLVTNGAGALCGLLRKRDLVLGAQAVAEGHRDRTGAFATRTYVTAQKGESLDAVLRRMVAHHAREAVIENAGVIVGVISVRLSFASEQAPSADAVTESDDDEPILSPYRPRPF